MVPSHNIHSVRVQTGNGVMSCQAVLGSLCTINGYYIEVCHVLDVDNMEKLGCICTCTFPTRKGLLQASLRFRTYHHVQ
jgi:hypothetical protein